jgi:hypothetical protein
MFKMLMQPATARIIAIDGNTVVSGQIGRKLTRNFFANEDVAVKWFNTLKGEAVWWEADIPVTSAVEFEHVMKLVGRVASDRMLLVTDSRYLMNALWEVLFALGAKDFIEYRKDAPAHLALEVTHQSPWYLRLGNAVRTAVQDALMSVKATFA